MQPIGVFDSGLGGLTVWKEIVSLMPNENTVYLADSKNAPYGIKSKEEIQALVRKNIEALIQNDAKIIIMACNTASTQAADIARQEFELPIVALEPAIKPAALYSKNHRVGVLATKGTLQSEKFLNTSEPFRESTHIFEVVGTGLVEAVEENAHESLDTQKLLYSYTDQLEALDVDSLVLGCTHYPFYRKMLETKYPNIRIFDSGKAIAQRTRDLLEKKNLLSTSNNHGAHHIYTNGNVDVLNQVIDHLEPPKNTTTQALSF